MALQPVGRPASASSRFRRSHEFPRKVADIGDFSKFFSGLEHDLHVDRSRGGVVATGIQELEISCVDYASKIGARTNSSRPFAADIAGVYSNGNRWRTNWLGRNGFLEKRHCSAVSDFRSS